MGSKHGPPHLSICVDRRTCMFGCVCVPVALSMKQSWIVVTMTATSHQNRGLEGCGCFQGPILYVRGPGFDPQHHIYLGMRVISAFPRQRQEAQFKVI